MKTFFKAHSRCKYSCPHHLQLLPCAVPAPSLPAWHRKPAACPPCAASTQCGCLSLPRVGGGHGRRPLHRALSFLALSPLELWAVSSGTRGRRQRSARTGSAVSWGSRVCPARTSPPGGPGVRRCWLCGRPECVRGKQASGSSTSVGLCSEVSGVTSELKGDLSGLPPTLLSLRDFSGTHTDLGTPS